MAANEVIEEPLSPETAPRVANGAPSQAPQTAAPPLPGRYTKRLDPQGLYLAWGGGAARGFAHLGIIQVLEERGIPIAGICGTSMGALVGAAYALLPKVDQVMLYFVDYIRSEHFDRVRYAFMRQASKADNEGKLTLRQKLAKGYLLGRSYVTGAVITFEDFQTEIQSLIPNKTFADARMPLFITAVDLTATREVLFDRGFLRSAVMASSAIPGVFPPVRSGSTVYVDGGWMNRIPVNPLLAFGAEKVLAVDVSDNPPPDIHPRRGFSILTEANRATQIRLHELQSERASLLWSPPVEGINWADFAQLEQVVQIGRDYAERHFDQVQALVDQKVVMPWWERVLRRMLPERPERPGVTASFDVRAIWDVEPADNEQ